MFFIHPESKPKGILKRWLESKEAYWKLRKCYDRRKRLKEKIICYRK